MKFHGRVHPGRLLDLATPIEIRIHQPRKCAGVTIKIWELDAFIGADGKPHREGTPDDLLATFTGSIEGEPRGARAPEWRKFVVEDVKIEEAPPDAMKFLLKFPGSDTMYEIPVISEVAEVEGTDYEIGFSIEVGGDEKFRTKVPCLVTPATVRPRIKEVLVIGFDDDGAPIMEDATEVPPSGVAAAIGAPPSNFDEFSTDPSALDMQLEQVKQWKLDRSGFLHGEEQSTVLHVRKGKKLRVFVGSKEQTAANKVPAALALPVADDGSVTVYRIDNAHRRSFFVGGGKVKTDKRNGASVVVFEGLFEGEAIDADRVLKGEKK